MNYSKPIIIAQNAPQGNYAAGCPLNKMGTDYGCKSCERSR